MRSRTTLPLLILSLLTTLPGLAFWAEPAAGPTADPGAPSAADPGANPASASIPAPAPEPDRAGKGRSLAPALPKIVEGGRTTSRRLVLVLHGGSYRPRTPLELAERAVEPLEDEARRLGLRLAAPIAPEAWLGWSAGVASRAPRLGPSASPSVALGGLDASTVWASPEGEALVMAYVDREVRRKRADPRRVYLAGHGAGATAAIHLAARHPERFAAIALWSGTPSPEWARPEARAASSSASSSSGRASRSAPRVVGLVGEPVPKLAPVGVYLWTGEQDDILDRDALALFVRRMREHEARGLGHELVWERGPGAHDYGPGGARKGLEFLKRHRAARQR